MTEEEEKKECGSMLIERFNLYLHHGFTVVSIAVNDEIGRVCVLRKSDFKRTENSDVSTECAKEEPYFLIEFYNANALPAMCFEKSTAIWDAPLESTVWLNNLVFVSCADGSLILCSPFSTEYKRFQICASPIGALVALRETFQLVLGTDSSELLLVDCTEMSQEKISKTSLEICSNVKLSNDERIVSMAVAKYHSSIVAVGMVNCIRIFDLTSNKRTNIVIPNNTLSPTVIWSLVFVDEYLFSGDSRGNVSVYNSKSGAFLKCITTHESAVLALATNGTLVFASGVDYRIQVIRGQTRPKDKVMDWTTVGQRIIHANDVRALACVGERWLLSGGAEHDIFITDAHMTLAFPILPRHSSITRGDDSCWIFMRYPNHLLMWCRYRCDQLLQSKNGGKLLDDVEIFNVTSETIGKPVKSARINVPSPNCHISHAVMSPNATHFAFFSEMGLKVFVVNRGSKACSLFKKIWDSEEEILECWASRHADDDDTMELDAESRTKKLVVTAMRMTNDDLFFAEDSFAVWRLRLRKKRSGSDLFGMFSRKEHGGNITQLHMNEFCSTLIGLNSNSKKSQVLKWCVHSEKVDDSLAEELPISQTVVDMTFVSDRMLLLVCAELDSQVVFFDLDAKSAVKVLSKAALRIGFNQFLCYVSDVHDDQVVLVTNKSKVRTLSQLKEAKPLMHIKRKQKSAVQGGHDNSFNSSKPNQVAEFCRSEPSWGFKISTLESTPVLSSRNDKRSRRSAAAVNAASSPYSVLLVGHQPLAAPSQMPMKIKRYERN